MLKKQITKILNFLSSLNLKPKLFTIYSLIKQQVTSWPRLSLLLIISLFIIYYPLGAYLTNSIDTDTTYEAQTKNSQSATIKTSAYLIKREINNKIWTPNLPFFFPASVLDNMPEFQLGLISGIKNIINSMSKKLPDSQERSLYKAADRLNYPATIWMFSPQNKLIPAPSSNSQYRRARKFLRKYNNTLALGENVFLKKPQDLQFILKQVQQDLQKSIITIETHIRENSNSLFDNKSDNVFFYQQGKLYSYYLLLKALGVDYKEIITTNNLYQEWTVLLKTLQDASALSPMIIRNAALDGSFAPNHLTTMGYYTGRAILSLQKINQNLNKISQ